MEQHRVGPIEPGRGTILDEPLLDGSGRFRFTTLKPTLTYTLIDGRRLANYVQGLAYLSREGLPIGVFCLAAQCGAAIHRQTD